MSAGSIGIESRFGGGRGRAVITASNVMEYAFEGDRLTGTGEPPPSVFTSALVEGLKTGDADRNQDGLVTLDELYNYIYDKVREASPQQMPGKWTFGMEGDLVIARRARPPTTPAPLPAELQGAIDSPFASIRAAAVEELVRLLQGTHAGLVLAAHLALKRLTEDDSRTVAAAATAALSPRLQPPRLPRLELSATAVDFGRIAYDARSPERKIRLGNAGEGSLNAQVTTQARWLKHRREGDELILAVDTTMAGEHEQTVTIDSDRGSATIHVRAFVEPMQQPAAKATAPITYTDEAPSGSGAAHPGQQAAPPEAVSTLGTNIPDAPAQAAFTEGSGQASGASALAQSSGPDMADVQNGREELEQAGSGPALSAQPTETQVQAPQLHRQKIFLCYRREDTQGFARGIYESLASKYGHEQIFRDIDSTPPGVRYSAWIESRVGQCSVMIVLIGNAWLSAKDHAGQRRLDLPKDWVRQEIETALRRDIPIIPVRVQGTPMPSENELPPSIADLTSFQSAEVADSRWAFDLGMLIQAIDNLIASD